MAERGDAHVAGGEFRCEVLAVQRSVRRDRRRHQRGPRARTGHLPRHDVRVVLEFRDEHGVAGTQHGAAVGLRHQVDGLCCAPCPDDLGGGRGMDAPGDALAGGLEGVGRGIGELVDAAMHVGVARLVVAADRVQDGARLLRRGGVVQVDDVVAAADEREVGADGIDVEGRGRWGAGRRAVHRAIPSSCLASSATRSPTTSARNPPIRSSRAVAALTPRERR